MGRASANGDGKPPAATDCFAHESQPHETAGRVGFELQQAENLVGRQFTCHGITVAKG